MLMAHFISQHCHIRDHRDLVLLRTVGRIAMADAAGRLFTAASTGNLEVVKNLITANSELIRAADLDGLYPGFTGRAHHVIYWPIARQSAGAVEGHVSGPAP